MGLGAEGGLTSPRFYFWKCYRILVNPLTFSTLSTDTVVNYPFTGGEILVDTDHMESGFWVTGVSEVLYLEVRGQSYFILVRADETHLLRETLGLRRICLKVTLEDKNRNEIGRKDVDGG